MTGSFSLFTVLLTFTSSLFLVCSAAGSAAARNRGVSSTDCGGCHGYEGNSRIAINTHSVKLGETATLRFTIEDPDAKKGGIYIELEQPADFSPSPGSGLAMVATGATHTSARSFAEGKLSFDLSWQVPSMPGASRFVVAVVGADGNGNNEGDEGNIAEFDVVYGCDAQTYYRDYDGDGHGNDENARDFCAGSIPNGYVPVPGDCNDFSATRFPGAVEYCNRKDDDCDGELDEDALPVTLYPDADGDGFYSADEGLSDDLQLGCVPFPGYADSPGDCDANNPNAHPDAEEVCDLYTDENCNGRIDERVRPLCGVGWCRRESFSCDVADCVPGPPSEERCNFIDDDCDGEVDEGELCPEGKVCAAGQCLDAESVTEATDSSAAGEKTPPSAMQPDSPPSSDETAPASSTCSHTPSPLRQELPLAMLLGALGLGLSRRQRVGKS